MKKIRYKKYFKFLFIKVLLSILLVICCYNFSIVKNEILYSNMSLLKLPFYFSKLLPNDKQLNDELVYNKLVYDNVSFDGKKNSVINYSFNGVLNLTDGIIIKIIKNANQYYSITVQDVNGFLYEYTNLKSVDLSIYTFVKSQTILGSLTFEPSLNGYCFDLYISKKGEYYDFYQLAEG